VTACAEHDNWLRLLLFTVGGTLFGIDLEQVDAMIEFSEQEREEVHWFHELAGYGALDVTYLSPTVLVIKTGNGSRFPLVVDRLEDIREYQWRQIAPLPPLLEPYLAERGIWGVTPSRDKPVLLIDCAAYFDSHPDRHTHSMKE